MKYQIALSLVLLVASSSCVVKLVREGESEGTFPKIASFDAEKFRFNGAVNGPAHFLVDHRNNVAYLGFTMPDRIEKYDFEGNVIGNFNTKGPIVGLKLDYMNRLILRSEQQLVVFDASFSEVFSMPCEALTTTYMQTIGHELQLVNSGKMLYFRSAPATFIQLNLTDFSKEGQVIEEKKEKFNPEDQVLVNTNRQLIFTVHQPYESSVQIGSYDFQSKKLEVPYEKIQSQYATDKATKFLGVNTNTAHNLLLVRYEKEEGDQINKDHIQVWNFYKQDDMTFKSHELKNIHLTEVHIVPSGKFAIGYNEQSLFFFDLTEYASRLNYQEVSLTKYPGIDHISHMDCHENRLVINSGFKMSVFTFTEDVCK